MSADQRSVITLQEFCDSHGIPYTTKQAKPEYDGGTKLVVASPFEEGKSGVLFCYRGFYCYRDTNKRNKFTHFCQTHGLPNPNKSRPKVAKDQELYQSFRQNTDVGKTPEGNLHYSYRLPNGVVETELVTTATREILLGLHRATNNGVLYRPGDIRTAFENWRADCLVSAPIVRLNIRCAELVEEGIEPYIVLDIGDPQRQVIIVTFKGHLIHPPVKGIRFLRDKKSPPLPIPRPGGNIRLLERYMNVGSAFPLVAAWIAYAMRPGANIIPPILLFVGPPGYGKSSTVIVTSEFLDPRPERKLSQSAKTVHDQLVAAQNQRLIMLNNVSKLTKEQSDFLCCLIEGVTSSNRRLFTDADVCTIAAQRPVVMTAVHDPIVAPDLADRALTIPVPLDLKRETPATFWRQFDEDKAFIMGVLLDGLSAGLAGERGIVLPGDVRLSGFLKFAEAAGRSWGYPSGLMFDLYRGLQAAPARARIEESPIGQAILSAGDVQGTLCELLSRWGLTIRAKDAAAELRLILPDLKKVGIVVDSSERDTSNTTIWKFKQ